MLVFRAIRSIFIDIDLEYHHTILFNHDLLLISSEELIIYQTILRH